MLTPKCERKLSLQKMLKAVTKDNLHSEQDWGARNARFCRRIPETTLAEVLEKLGVLLE
ncbi:MAG: hypothetical protein WC728_14115 [Elusimicrobiota bacterium]